MRYIGLYLLGITSCHVAGHEACGVRDNARRCARCKRYVEERVKARSVAAWVR